MLRPTSDWLFQGVIDNMMKAHTADVRATCASLHAAADSAAVERAAKDVSEEMVQATEAFETLSAAFTAQRVLAREIWTRAEEAKARVPDHLHDKFQAELGSSRTAEQVAAELEDVQGQLQLIANVAPNTIQRYEELKALVRGSLPMSKLPTGIQSWTKAMCFLFQGRKSDRERQGAARYYRHGTGQDGRDKGESSLCASPALRVQGLDADAMPFSL